MQPHPYSRTKSYLGAARVRLRSFVLAALAGAAAVGSACRDADAPVSPIRAREAARRSVALVPNCPAGQKPLLPSSNAYGLNVNAFYAFSGGFADGSFPQAASLLRQANIGWVRMDFRWSMIQQGGPDYWAWIGFDESASRAACEGLNILGVISWIPTWASSAPSDPAPHLYGVRPDKLPQWETFVRELATHYPMVKYWSILNEPNAYDHFRGTPGEYDSILHHASIALRSVNDGNGPRYVVAPEVALGNPADPNDPAYAYLKRVLQARGADIDVVGLHAYNPPSGIADMMRLSTLQTRTGVTSWPWPVWLTEAGNTDCPTAGQPTCGGPIPSLMYMQDAKVMSDLTTTLDYMNGTNGKQKVNTRWAKTFWWHAWLGAEHGDDRGILGGMNEGRLFASEAFYKLSDLAGMNGPPVCGEASCAPMGSAYISHYTGLRCTGTESYYMPYGFADGRAHSWNGTGVAGTVQRRVVNRSWRGTDGACRESAWPDGNTLDGFVTVYRKFASAPTVCADTYGCKPVTSAYISHFTNADCTGIESYYTQYDNGNGGRTRSWDGNGITGVVAFTRTNKSWKMNDGGGDGTGCRRNEWPSGNTLSGFVTVYR